MSLHISYADVITYANKATYTDVTLGMTLITPANITSDHVTALTNLDVTCKGQPMRLISTATTSSVGC